MNHSREAEESLKEAIVLEQEDGQAPEPSSLLDIDISDDEPVTLTDDSESTLEDDSAAAAAEAVDEDEKEAYSQRVQKRVDKLVYERNIERERVARQEAEIQALRERLDKFDQDQQQQANDREQQSSEQKRQELLKRKRVALEVGDYDALNDIDDELFELKLQAKLKASDPGRNDARTAQAAPQAQAPQISQAQRDWEQQNPWLYDSRQSAKKDKANQIFQHMLDKEGYDIEDPETYAVLDKRLKRETPPPTSGPDRGQVVGQSPEKSFTPEDRRRMRDWGLNPDNPVERKEWLKNKSA